MPPLIQVENLFFSYPTQHGTFSNDPILRGISLRIEREELVALVGANGSGKTTLARCLNALLLPTKGRVLIEGMDTQNPANRRKIHSMVGMVFQFPEDQIVASTVEEDVAFGPENLGLPPGEIRQRVEDALREVGLWEDRFRPPHLLSAGQMQRLALAGALAMRPACIIFDEATTMLDPLGRRKALEIMSHLQQVGLTILFITHYMDEAAQAERVIALHRGNIALDGSPHQIFSQPDMLAELGLDLPPASQIARRLRTVWPALPEKLMAMNALQDALPLYPGRDSVVEEQIDNLQNQSDYTPQDSLQPFPMINVENLGHVYLAGTPLAHRSLQDVSMQVQPGSSHGLAGVTGSGKSTLLQHLNGLLRPQEGSVRVGAFDLNQSKVTMREIVKTVGLVFQNPEMSFFEQYVGDEIAFGPRQMGLHQGLADRVRQAMEIVGLDFDQFKDRLTFTLSGGERRKVALASILALRPEILLLDEPLAGLDPVSTQEIRSRLAELRQSGITFVLSSHHMEDISLLAERMSILQGGKVLLAGSPSEVFGQMKVLYRAGLEPPCVTLIAEGLRERGWPLPAGIIDLDILIREVTRVNG